MSIYTDLARNNVPSKPVGLAEVDDQFELGRRELIGVAGRRGCCRHHRPGPLGGEGRCHVAAHHAGELAGDGEAQPGATETLRRRGIGLGELLKQLGLLLGRGRPSTRRDRRGPRPKGGSCSARQADARARSARPGWGFANGAAASRSCTQNSCGFFRREPWLDGATPPTNAMAAECPRRPASLPPMLDLHCYASAAAGPMLASP